MGSTGTQNRNGRAGSGHSLSLKSGDTFNCQRQCSSAHRLWQCALLGSRDHSGGRDADEACGARVGGSRSLRVATFCSRPSSHVVLLRAQSNRGLGGAPMRQSVRLCRNCVTEPSQRTVAASKSLRSISSSYARRPLREVFQDAGSIPARSTASESLPGLMRCSASPTRVRASLGRGRRLSRTACARNRNDKTLETASSKGQIVRPLPGETGG